MRLFHLFRKSGWLVVLTGFVLLGACARVPQEERVMANRSDGREAEEQGDEGTPAVGDLTSPPAPEPAPPSGPDKQTAIKGSSTQDCYRRSPRVAGGKKKKGGRCEPQSLPFARCRTGIQSCGLGYENGPLTWFACEKRRQKTTTIPEAGAVLILAANKHHMPTGHVAVVEKVVAMEPPRYRIFFSHTNYDRQCSLETDIEAIYCSVSQRLDIISGAWKDWGKGLPVAGFIRN